MKNGNTCTSEFWIYLSITFGSVVCLTTSTRYLMALIGLKQKAKIILCKVICLIQKLPHTGILIHVLQWDQYWHSEIMKQIKLPMFAIFYQVPTANSLFSTCSLNCSTYMYAFVNSLIQFLPNSFIYKILHCHCTSHLEIIFFKYSKEILVHSSTLILFLNLTQSTESFLNESNI